MHIYANDMYMRYYGTVIFNITHFKRQKTVFLNRKVT
jgi:hypothetical protein